MSCGQLGSWFRGKAKEPVGYSEEDYTYWMQLYNNAKARKMEQRRIVERNKTQYGLAKFESVHSWLHEVSKDPDYVDMSGSDYLQICDYIEMNSLERRPVNKRLHSAHNSDYSYWSLDDSRSTSSTTSSTADSDTHSEYCFQLRQQAQNLYWVY